MSARRRPRRPFPPPSTDSSSELSHLKSRSLLALRGLSDLGTVAVLHELSTRLLLGFGVAATAAVADSQLLLGGLLGVWTAAAFAERLREQTAALIEESAALPARWDAACVYRPTLDADDAVAAVAWLYALDEMEGPAAANMLRSLAEAEAPRVRKELAVALAGYPARSNAAVAVLSMLADDRDVDVRAAADDALSRFRAAGVLVPAAEPQRVAEEATEMDMSAVLDRLFEDALIENDMSRGESQQSSRVLDVVAEQVEAMGSVALSRPDLRKLGAAQEDEEAVVKEDAPAKKVQVPLFEGLKWDEVHGLSTLALVLVGYELLSVVDGGDLPLRFIGLGWLLAVGGLVAYPQSGELWRKFKKALDTGVVRPR